jgi:hypothetical protein
MTRKRYIKLLMGCQGYSRNEARREAHTVTRHKALVDKNNQKIKSFGGAARRPQAGYKEYYDCIVMLGGKKKIEELRRMLPRYDAQKIHKTADGQTRAQP